jgi:hypothetical protein
MATQTVERVRALASAIIDQLAAPQEYERLGGGILVDAVASEPDDYPGAERCRVSFGNRGGWRAVDIVIMPTVGDELRANMAWAAYQIADAFQDEVTESLGIARPACPGHPHPMRARVEGDRAWWDCPKDSDHRQPIWPAA